MNPNLNESNERMRRDSESRILLAMGVDGTDVQTLADRVLITFRFVRKVCARLIEDGRAFTAWERTGTHRGQKRLRYFSDERQRDVWQNAHPLQPVKGPSKRPRVKQRGRVDNQVAAALERKRRVADKVTAAKVVRGPAGLPGDPDLSCARRTIAPKPVGRYEVLVAEPLFRHLRPGQYADDAASCAARATCS